MLGFKERLVALDVDVDVCVDLLGDGVDAVGAAGQIGRSELEWPTVGATEVGYFVRVRCNEDAVELRTGSGGFEDPCQHRFTGDGAEDLTGEARGGEPGGNNAEDAGLLLFAMPGIKYDWSCLCRSDPLHFVDRPMFLPARQIHPGAV